MKRLLFFLCAGAGLSLLSSGAQAQLSYQVTNLTFSGGDPIYPITDDVTFTSLALTETFQDTATQTISLFDPADPTQTPTSTLDTGVFNLVSSSLAFTDPAHGRVSSASLTGTFDLTTLGIQTAFGGPITTVTVNPTFTTPLNLSSFGLGTPLVFANIVATDATTGTLYSAGTLEVSGVPEPGAVAFLVAGGLGLVSVWHRRK